MGAPQAQWTGRFDEKRPNPSERASSITKSHRRHPVDEGSDAMPVPLHLTHIPELDHLIALEYGRVDEGQPEHWWRRVGSQIGYLHDGGVGPEVGFKVMRFSELDVDAREVGAIWEPPHFDAPTLGLRGRS
jgi:hypothetical protein